MTTQDFLSQEEVDDLLQGVTSEIDDSDDFYERHQRNGIRELDIANFERLVRGRLPLLEIIFEKTALLCRSMLKEHCSVWVSTSSIRIQKFTEFVRNLVVPTNLNVVNCNNLDGQALIVFDPNLIFLITDIIFGGDGRYHTRVEGRVFTTIEIEIINHILDKFLHNLNQVWSQYLEKDYKFEFSYREMSTQYIDIAMPNEIVISVTFTLEIAGTTAEIHVCLPTSMLHPIMKQLGGSLITTYKKGISIESNPLIKMEVMATLPDTLLGSIEEGKFFPISGYQLMVDDYTICPVTVDSIETTDRDFRIYDRI